MPTIHLTSFVAAPAEVVFDLSRHVGLHKISMQSYKEEAVSGTRMGLIEKDDTITWKARHLLKNRLLKVKITDMQIPQSFTVEQAKGDFKVMKHEHHFKPCDNGTIMIDLFYFESPYGFIGQWFSALYLGKYLKRLLEKRHDTIKEYAEGGKWKNLLGRI
ncbi:MAG: SRPBCC family protein [Chitinophagaceae bacterium]|nr:SRPBCC family protein [Chitinophagaceae bacterium]MBL0153836.1 SRPBCC family protein [Chitinophagaceae bacterium]